MDEELYKRLNIAINVNGNSSSVEQRIKWATEIKEYLEKQKAKSEHIFGKNINNKQLHYKEGKLVFPKGTLIHCAGECSYEKLVGIKDKGILAGDFIGIPETDNGETFFCADFYKADTELTDKQFFEKILLSDQNGFCRSPLGDKTKYSYKIAFIIQPSDEIEEMLSSDMYKEENQGHIMQKALKLVDYSTLSKNNIAAIPYGLPSEAISGIVVGDLLLKNEKYMQILRDLFPDCYIISKDGKVYFDPSLSREENESKKSECIQKVEDSIKKMPEGPKTRARERIERIVQNMNISEKPSSMPISENIEGSVKNISNGMTARDMRGTQSEIKNGYEELKNLTQTKENDSQGLDN